MIKDPTARAPYGEARIQEIGRALDLLNEALEIIDSTDLPAQIGARLDAVICAVQDARVRAVFNNPAKWPN